MTDIEQASESRRRLRATIKALDLDERYGERLELIAQADPELDANADVYAKVNQELRQIENLTVRHVTGEARALADASHRRVLREIGDDERAQLGCYFNAGPNPNAWDFLTREHRFWSALEWFDLVDLIDLAAARAVGVKLLDKAQPVHFSLFGDDLVLLQEPHEPGADRKWVWFGRSPELVSELRPRVEALLQSAARLPAEGFTEVIDWLYSYETVSVAESLADADGGSKLDKQIVSRLEDLGLADGGQLTALGRAWFESLLS